MPAMDWAQSYTAQAPTAEHECEPCGWTAALTRLCEAVYALRIPASTAIER